MLSIRNLAVELTFKVNRTGSTYPQHGPERNQSGNGAFKNHWRGNEVHRRNPYLNFNCPRQISSVPGTENFSMSPTWCLNSNWKRERILRSQATPMFSLRSDRSSYLNYTVIYALPPSVYIITFIPNPFFSSREATHPCLANGKVWKIIWQIFK